MSKWSKEPWSIGPAQNCIESDAGTIAQFWLQTGPDGRYTCESDARRAVECVNAMAGIDAPARLRTRLAELEGAARAILPFVELGDEAEEVVRLRKALGDK